MLFCFWACTSCYWNKIMYVTGTGWLHWPLLQVDHFNLCSHAKTSMNVAKTWGYPNFYPNRKTVFIQLKTDPDWPIVSVGCSRDETGSMCSSLCFRISETRTRDRTTNINQRRIDNWTEPNTGDIQTHGGEAWTEHSEN